MVILLHLLHPRFHVIINFILTTSEVISLMANLNARKRLSEPVDNGSDNIEAILHTTKTTTLVPQNPNRQTEGETTLLQVSFINKPETEHAHGRGNI